MKLKNYSENLDLEELSLNQLLELLEDTRKEEELTQAEVAEKLEVSRRTYLSWIHGENRPSKDNKAKIMEYIALAKARQVEEKFNEAEGMIKVKFLGIPLPEATWEKLKSMEKETDQNIVAKALKEYVEKEEDQKAVKT